MGGGPSTTTTTVDPVYNAGMLKLSQEQQGMASEMFNYFKYGVTYDPNAYEDGLMIDGKWVPRSELTREQIGGDKFIENPEYQAPGYRDVPIGGDAGEYREYIPGSGPDVSQYILNPNYNLEQRKAGDVRGYDPEAQTSELDYLQKVINANAGILGLQTDVSKAQLESQKELIPITTDITKQQLWSQKQRQGLATKFLRDAKEGIDVNERMDQAQAAVQHGFKNADKSIALDVSQYGLDPGSGRFTGHKRSQALAEASGIAGARTAAKNQAEQEDFERKRQALSVNI